MHLARIRILVTWIYGEDSKQIASGAEVNAILTGNKESAIVVGTKGWYSLGNYPGSDAQFEILEIRGEEKEQKRTDSLPDISTQIKSFLGDQVKGELKITL